MERKCKDWIETYLEYIEDTESPHRFHFWVAVSSITSALRKKALLKLGRINVYANMYIVLIGPPGSRKSQAIKWGLEVMEEVNEIITSSDATTPEAFIQDLAEAKVDELLPDGTMMEHSSLSIISREFEIFLGQKQNNSKMIVQLTDMFDAPEKPWTYRTKHKQGDPIPSLYLTILGATTPDSLSQSLPMQAIGGGMTSRIMFIYADKKKKKVPFPEISQKVIDLKERLIYDLALIARISGEYLMDATAKEFWVKWYMDYEEISASRLCADPAFDGWYERKPLFINKVSMVCAASRSDALIITKADIKRAIGIVESMEPFMHHAFAAVGRSELTVELDEVQKLIRNRKKITSMKLRQAMLKDLDDKKFDLVMDTLVKSGKVQKLYRNGQITLETKDIIYAWRD